jgi:hypothetical protein
MTFPRVRLTAGLALTLAACLNWAAYAKPDLGLPENLLHRISITSLSNQGA